MKKITILVSSQATFNNRMQFMQLTSENVEQHRDMAFISIIGTEECLKYYLDEADTVHYFNDAENVCNLEFDDITHDIVYHGHQFYAMSEAQAEKTFNFIDKIINNDVQTITFHIHCRAGYSRSRAVAEFIFRYCLDNDIDVEYTERNEYYDYINRDVLMKLNHVYYNKYNIYK